MDRGGAAGGRLRGVAPTSNARGFGEKLTYIANQWDRMLVFLYERARRDGQQLRGEPNPPAVTMSS